MSFSLVQSMYIANIATPIFLCDLDRYGRIGHQTSRMLTAFLLAHLTGGKFIPLDYKFFPYRANKIFNFSHSERACTENFFIRKVISLSKGFREPHGNDCFDFSSIEEIKLALTIMSQSNTIEPNASQVELPYTIIKLPFDQAPGLLLKLLNNPLIYEDFKRVFVGLVDNIKGYCNSFDLVIHIRRGDVTKESHPDWWIDDDIYINILNELFHDNSFMPNVCICTQRGISQKLIKHVNQISESFKGHLTIRASKEGWSNNDEVEDFLLMSNAKVLMGGLSSFPCLAALASQNRFIFLGNNEPPEYPFGLNPELSFSLAEYESTQLATRTIANKLFEKLSQN